MKSQVLIFVITVANAASLNVGDKCHVESTGETGICKLLPKCLEAQNNLRFNAIRPTSCGFQKYTPVVCCSNATELVSRFPVSELDSLPMVVRKCREYSQYVFSNTSVLLYDIGPGTSLRKSSDRCGNAHVTLISGGTPATAREFPHSAVLGYTEPDGQISWDCGGSLISTRFVLTAGHCITSSEYDVTIVRLGELVLNDDKDDATVIDISIERIIIHPDYKPPSSYNDIALLKLSHKITLSPYIRPICLPTDDLNPKKALATGWGSTGSFGPKSNALLKVLLDSYSNMECNGIFQYDLNRKIRKGIKDTQICFGSRTDEKDTCTGDSGGPLQVYHSDIYCMYLQLGITSFGFECGIVENYPGVYTRVYNYVPWIESVVWAPGEDD